MTETGEVAIVLLDLSEGGCFVQHIDGMHPGEQLSLRIRLPHHDQVFVVGHVLSTDPELGWAVRFVNLENDQRFILRRVVESLQPATGDPAPASEFSSETAAESLPEVEGASPSWTDIELSYSDW